jgi:small GTP-binding protein
LAFGREDMALENINNYKMKIKICLVGDAGVGKTSLIRRYVLDMFDDNYITTLGTKVSKKRVVIKKNDKKIDLTLSIWDVLGQEDFKNIQNMAFKGSKGVILVCDKTRLETLGNVSKWQERVMGITNNIPSIILVNKSDLEEQSNLTEENVKELATNLNMPYLFTSAKDGSNVIKAFYKISDLIADEFTKKM